jgi:hypothetical protein
VYKGRISTSSSLEVIAGPQSPVVHLVSQSASLLLGLVGDLERDVLREPVRCFTCDSEPIVQVGIVGVGPNAMLHRPLELAGVSGQVKFDGNHSCGNATKGVA